MSDQPTAADYAWQAARDAQDSLGNILERFKRLEALVGQFIYVYDHPNDKVARAKLNLLHDEYDRKWYPNGSK